VTEIDFNFGSILCVKAATAFSAS